MEGENGRTRAREGAAGEKIETIAFSRARDVMMRGEPSTLNQPGEGRVVKSLSFPAGS